MPWQIGSLSGSGGGMKRKSKLRSGIPLQPSRIAKDSGRNQINLSPLRLQTPLVFCLPRIQHRPHPQEYLTDAAEIHSDRMNLKATTTTKKREENGRKREERERMKRLNHRNRERNNNTCCSRSSVKRINTTAKTVYTDMDLRACS